LYRGEWGRFDNGKKTGGLMEEGEGKLAGEVDVFGGVEGGKVA
jgi:hypothetical protein